MTEHPELASGWRGTSDSLIVLAERDGPGLGEFSELLDPKGIVFSSFREADFAYELTALALAPSAATRRACSSLPLAMRPGAVSPEAARSAVDREARLRALVGRMRACEQTAGQDVLEHGWSVWCHLSELLAHLGGTHVLDPARWRVPTWLEERRDALRARLPSRWALERYSVLHDCGKPDCLVVDEDGRRHFPGHAEASAATYGRLAADSTMAHCGESARIAGLIGADMDVHLLSGDAVASFAQREDAAGLLLSALAEVHSNAALFGGIDSPSFKAKWKHVDRRGRAICRAWQEFDAARGGA